MKKVISSKNLPNRSPIMATVVYATALSYWNAPEWLWGALGILMAIIWIAWILGFAATESVDIFSTESPNAESNSKFSERLAEALAKGEK